MDKDIEQMIEEMSSFYLNHLPIDASFHKWLESVVDAWKLYQRELEHIHESTLPSTTPTLKTIPYFELDIKKGLYDKVEAKRIKMLTEPDQIILTLIELGYYVDLEFWRVGTDTPLVYSMDLYMDFEKKDKLVLNKDFYIRRNKLFIMPDYILKTNRITERFHAFEIKVNDYGLELNWGDNIPIRVPLLMPRFQYRDLVEAYNKLLFSDFYIRDMKNAIMNFTYKNEIDIWDVISKTIPPSLKRLYTERYLSPLDFIVRLEEEDLFDKIQTNVILHMLMETKEEQVYFWLIFAILRLSEFEAEEEIAFTVYPPGVGDDEDDDDKFDAEDNHEQKIIIEYEDEFFCNPYYDGKTREYDFQDKPYDDEDENCMSLTMEATFDDPHLNMDDDLEMDSREKITYDRFEVRIIQHPEIPRGYNVSGKTIRFNKNKGITDSYEIFASKDGKDFELIHTIQHESAPESISYQIPNEIASKMRYYKIRSKERIHYSLFSLVKEV